RLERVKAWTDKWLREDIVLEEYIERLPTEVSGWTLSDMVDNTDNWKRDMGVCLEMIEDSGWEVSLSPLNEFYGSGSMFEW
ncbi:hypothetical protein A2U01_0025050, partial [Trifolium medium]|nr:hypothetical protein [Trifolium medium]